MSDINENSDVVRDANRWRTIYHCATKPESAHALRLAELDLLDPHNTDEEDALAMAKALDQVIEELGVPA